MAAVGMESKIRSYFCSLTSGIYIEKVYLAAKQLIRNLSIQVGLSVTKFVGRTIKLKKEPAVSCHFIG